MDDLDLLQQLFPPEDEEKQIPKAQDLKQYHICNDSGKCVRPYDNAIVTHIKQQCPMFILGGIVYLYDKGVYVADMAGARLCGMIKSHIQPELINYNTVKRIYNLFFLDSDLIRTFDQINQYPASWICFVNCMYDARTGETHELSSDYYCINQIPWNYEPDTNYNGEVTERYLQTALHREDIKTIWQIFGLLMTRDNSLQKLILLWGERGTGKSTLLRLMGCLLGQQNISSISLQKLEEKFYAIQLLGKLANICGDLSSTALQTVATIKQITGGDTISDSYKGKDVVTFTPYTRLVFSCNSVPVSLDEKSNAFFERLIIIKMDKRPDSPDRELDTKLASEMPYIINKAMQAVKEMYAENGIFESGSSKQLVGELYNDSDSVQAFLTARTTKETSQSIKTTELLTGYKQFCQEQEREPLSRTNFYRNLRGKGIGKKTIHGVEYFAGLGWKSENWTPISTKTTQQELPAGWN